MPRKAINFLSLFLFLASAACGDAATPISPPATLAPLRVIRTTELAPLLPALEVCSRALPGIALLVDEIPGDALVPEEMQRSGAQLAFLLGEPQGELAGEGHPFPLGVETLDVVVNARNPLKSLTAGQLARIFNGEIRDWGEAGGSPGEIRLWTLPPGSPLYTLLASGLSIQQPDFPGAWLLQAPAWLAPSPDDMISQVTDDPGAAGFLPHAWLMQAPEGKLRALTIPSELMKRLSLPVLAVTAGEPQGVGRELLACLQTGAGQQVLRGTYQPWQASSP